MDVLAVVAHPDDADIFCGGTLAKHADRGDDVAVAYMTRGEFGGFDTTEEALADLREAEAEAAAQRLGVEFSFLGFRDGRVTYSLENRLAVVDAIRAHDPDVVVTHYRDDPHPDHETTSRLVTDAYYMASLPLLETEFEPTDPDNVYFFGKPTSSFEPEVYVDVTGYVDRKVAAIREHESQLEWLAEHGGVDADMGDVAASARAEARVLGRQCGVAFAEGFTALHDRPVDYLG